MISYYLVGSKQSVFPLPATEERALREKKNTLSFHALLLNVEFQKDSWLWRVWINVQINMDYIFLFLVSLNFLQSIPITAESIS